jgi:hypothetical protein
MLQRMYDGIDDTVSRIGERAIKVKKNGIVFHIKAR